MNLFAKQALELVKYVNPNNFLLLILKLIYSFFLFSINDWPLSWCSWWLHTFFNQDNLKEDATIVTVRNFKKKHEAGVAISQFIWIWWTQFLTFLDAVNMEHLFIWILSKELETSH
ncbi:uncharacterized protein LOC131614962 [Vicia villosa]|uniref:uncharacterized protein LOC131614962 n=1 Tax=Vicia villosa TaxID=3911 RepID=UPI00273CEE7E|nr:uncharacterized protein LOC131614962 [Vicia villosa]